MSEPSFLGGRFPPHRILAGWLGEAGSARLLAYTLAAEAQFIPTRLAHEGTGRLETLTRQSSVLKDLGDFARPLRRKALALQAELEADFEMDHTLPNSTQMEVVAHGDGAFYRPHTDTFTGDQYTPGAGGVSRWSIISIANRAVSPAGISGSSIWAAARRSMSSPSTTACWSSPRPPVTKSSTSPVPAARSPTAASAVNIWLCG